MTQPLLAHQTSAGRMYSRSPEEPPKVPSITTIISQEDKDLGGWHAYMATQALIKDERLATADLNMRRRIARESVSASETYRDAAATRGDRVHYYCEQYSKKILGLDNDLEAALEDLQKRGEQGFVQQFEQWFSMYKVEPVMTEVTVWNASLGYAGTLDLIARINGRLCIVDYKTKSVDRSGKIKPLSTDVVMQLAAGAQAEEYYEEEDGQWYDWPFAEEPLLIALGLANTDHKPVMVNSEALRPYWLKFWSLKQVWEANRVTKKIANPLQQLPVPPQ
ncbi:MAG: cytochrome [Micrococcaceae bacterium]